MNWTEQQIEAITAEGSDILVSAAAGSGKTAVLTERIKRMVTEKGIPLERMLVVTFTNAAASEMREKILDALRKEEIRLSDLPDGHPEIKKKSFVRRQIRNAASAEICTFHRFSMNVVRRFFFLTDIDPHFTICDESYGNILREKSLDALFEERFESGDEEFRQFLDAYSDLKNENRVRRMITQVYDFIMNMPEPFEWLHHQVMELDCSAEELAQSPAYLALRSGVRKEIERALFLAEKLTEEASRIPELNNRNDGKVSLFQKIEGNCDTIRSLAADFDSLPDAELAERITNINWNRLVPGKSEKEIWQQVKDSFSSQTKLFKEILKKVSTRLPHLSIQESAERIRATLPFGVILEDLVIDFATRFTAAKREKNMLDFNDVEHEAYRILTHPEHREAAEEYRNRFDSIFIDEYQDSSRIQEAIIRCVSSDNNVYMVGDVKQSIYKFRQADPDIFIEKYNGFDEGLLPGNRIDLSKNYRSKGGVIRAVNGIFRNIMSREQSGIDYDQAAELIQGSGYPDGGPLDYGVSLHLAEVPSVDQTNNDNPSGEPDLIEEEISQLSRAQIEGELIANLAAERLGQRIYDDKLGMERDANYGDIVILVRSGTNMDVYARALMERGLPAFVSGGEGFYETPEIEVFMNLLKVIDNRRRDKELISVLYSSIEGFRFTINELASIRIYNMKGSYCDAFLSYAFSEKKDASVRDQALMEKCSQAALKLEEWHRESRYLPLDDFIWKLMTETGYYNYVSALPSGARRAANLRLLVEKAGEFVRSYGGSLFTFLRFEAQMKEKGSRIPQASNTGDTSNMIRIMTIHKSKGLEFPIVIVPDLAAGIRHDTDSTDLQIHKKLGISLKNRNRSDHTEYWTLPYQSILQIKKEEDLEEEKRILYVAMTRAKDELILTAAKKNLKRHLQQNALLQENGLQSPDQRLLWVYFNAKEAGIPVFMYQPEDFSSKIRIEERESLRVQESIENGFPDFKDPAGLTKIIQKRLDYLYPFRKDSAAKSKYSVTELNRTMLGGQPDAVQYIQITRAEQEEAATLLSEEKYRSEAPEPDSALESSQEPYDSAHFGNGEKHFNLLSEIVIPRFLSEETQLTPAVKGTLIHKVLELIDYSERHDRETVAAFCQSLVARGILSEKEATVIPTDQIAAFFHSDLGRRVCHADKRWNEWAFTMKKHRRTGNLSGRPSYRATDAGNSAG